MSAAKDEAQREDIGSAMRRSSLAEHIEHRACCDLPPLYLDQNLPDPPSSGRVIPCNYALPGRDEIAAVAELLREVQDFVEGRIDDIDDIEQWIRDLYVPAYGHFRVMLLAGIARDNFVDDSLDYITWRPDVAAHLERDEQLQMIMPGGAV